MKIIFYIVTGRYGTEMDKPRIFSTRESAQDYITERIAERVFSKYAEDLAAEDIPYSDKTAIVEWGIRQDYCTETMYQMSDDWSEFDITEKIINTDDYMHEGDKEYWDDDFFSIEGDGDDKEIHFHGYFYDEGNPGDNKDGQEDPNYTSRCVEYTGLYYPLKEFLKIRDKEGNKICDWITDEAAEVNQYISDMTQACAIRSMNEYYSGNPAKELALKDITMDTPAGDYVDHEVEDNRTLTPAQNEPKMLTFCKKAI